MATKEKLIIESLFQIVDKDSQDVPFLLNPYQTRLDATLTGRDIVPKARQLGISAYFLARYTAKCLSRRNTRAVVISHEKESTERMLARVHYYLENIRGPKAMIKNSSKNEITFPKTNSMFYIGTAGARKFGRGDMITDLHCSEVAFWEDPKSLTAGLFQAVPRESGEIAIESTGKGVGNWYHRMCMRAAESKSRYRLHFFNWLDAPEYRVPMSEDELAKFVPSSDLEEDKLLQLGLSPSQLMFRREKLEELDYDLTLFKQEYPITLDECFQSTGASFFSKINLVKTDEWKHLKDVDPNLWGLVETFKHHQHRYAIGVDVGGGVRKNRSVIEVIDIDTWEQVAEWVSDTTDPAVLAEKVSWLGRHFNMAFVTVETNNHGAVTLLQLVEGSERRNLQPYPSHLLYRNDKQTDNILGYGYKTTQRTRPIIIGGLRKEFIEGFTLHSELTKNELETFVENENGRLEAEEGCYDDRVLALAVCLEGAKASPYIYAAQADKRAQAAHKDPFELDEALKELRLKHSLKGSEYPIPRQDAPDLDYGHSIYH